MSAAPLHVAYVTWEYPPSVGGGIGPCVQALATGLAERGHTVTVITTTPASYPCRSADCKLTVVRLPQKPEPADARERLSAWRTRSRRVARFLSRFVPVTGVDLIEFCDYRGEAFDFLSDLHPSRPLVLARLHTPTSVVASFNRSQLPAAALEEYEHIALRRVDAWLAPSQAVLRETTARVGETRPALSSPHAVDPLFLRPHLSAPREQPEVLYVGRLEQRKGVETLVRAASAFLAACPEMRLKLIGADTPYGPACSSTQHYLQGLLTPELRAKIDFVGPVGREALIASYLRARFCVFPSLFENFPNTCLEAMALGAPIVAGANSGMAEMLEHGVSGRLVPSGDVEALAREMIDLNRADPETRTRMGAAAAQRVRARYSPQVIAEETEALYAGLLASHRAASAAAPLVARSRTATQDAAGPAPRVAVIIPCYNHGAFLAEAVQSARDQTHAPSEITIVDDGSTDANTQRVVEQLAADGLCVIRQENHGLSAARNRGVRSTAAPFFVPLDADDRLEPTFIERLLPPLLQDVGLGYCYSGVRFFGALQGAWETPAYDPRRLLVENLSVATAVVRRAAFDEVGGYREDMRGGFEDWDFWIALLAQGFHGQRVDAPLFSYRKHTQGSMLSGAQRLLAELRRRMIAHEPDLFETVLGVDLSEAPDRARADELFEGLMARAELDSLERSRFWRLLRWCARAGIPGWRRGEDGVDLWAPRDEDPRLRLGRLRRSRPFRLIESVKATAIYDWYATRKHGPNYRPAPAPSELRQ